MNIEGHLRKSSHLQQSLLGLSAEVLLNIFFEAAVCCDSIYLEDAVGVLIKPCR